MTSMGTNMEEACRLESHSKVHIPDLFHTCSRSVPQNVLKLMNEQLTFYEARDGRPPYFLDVRVQALLCNSEEQTVVEVQGNHTGTCSATVRTRWLYIECKLKNNALS